MKNNDWGCIPQHTIDPYVEICTEAVENESTFSKFKKDPRYTSILEHVSPEQGNKYIDGISQYDIDEDLINKFKENDTVGGSSLVNYDKPYGSISPSTLRYIKNSLDISDFYGEGQLNKIVEIGGGYGGLCKSISCLCDFDQYHIYDIDAASKLQQKYLSQFNMDNIFFHTEIDEIKEVDLVVSNYAYSELNGDLQEQYYEKVIKNAKKVYMILNKGEVDREVFLERARKDFKVKVEQVLDFWPPNGYLFYTTMTRK